MGGRRVALREESGHLRVSRRGEALERWQQRRLNRHVASWGSYWDRDILACVEAAGLRVVELRRTNCGTIYFIRCRRPDAPPD